METILNLAWVLCAIGLVASWLVSPWGSRAWGKRQASGRLGLDCVPGRRLQILALAVVVLLLLPVISLSDDLVAMQGPAETDSCLRRALNAEDGQHSALQGSFALIEPFTVAPVTLGFLQEYHPADHPTDLSSSVLQPIESRPPPQA